MPVCHYRNDFDEEKEPNLTAEEYMQDIHCISSLLKAYFRELPNPLLTYQLYDKFAVSTSSAYFSKHKCYKYHIPNTFGDFFCNIIDQCSALTDFYIFHVYNI
jgi:hypothetical protein